MTTIATITNTSTGVPHQVALEYFMEKKTERSKQMAFTIELWSHVCASVAH